MAARHPEAAAARGDPPSLGRARLVCLAAYLVAGAVALAVGWAAREQHPLAVALLADLAATGVIFSASFALGNSSLYDPYWSVAPLPIALYWALGPGAEESSGVRQVLVIALLAIWGARLTGNWLRGWQGLGHEDWRYVDMKRQSGRAWWPVSFAAVHLFPTLIVFAGLLPAYAALAEGRQAFGALDLLATLVTGGGIALEARADMQLRRFVRSGRSAGATLQTGLWAWSRHPNYLGENLFWWGLFLFALAAAPRWAWTGVGPLAITVMFLAASLPMIERRMRERRPDYAAYAERVPRLLPRPWRR